MRRRGNRSLRYISGTFRRSWLIIAIFICSVPGVSVGQNPASRPILFLHGFCGDSDAWKTLRDPLFGELQSQFPVLYPTPTDATAENPSGNYDVYYDNVAGVTFLLNGIPIPENEILPNARFFSIRFYDPYDGQFNAANVVQISILNQADQLAHVVAVITKVTQIEDVILVAHSMGGLVARAYLENLASPFSCSTYNGGANGVPDYTHGCLPGGTAYQPNVARLIDLDTPNAGTNLAQSFLDGLYPGCIDIPSTARDEMTPSSQFLQTLNYYETDIAKAATIPAQVKVQSIESFYSDPSNFPLFILLGWGLHIRQWRFYRGEQYLRF
jgi:pimeloyl-ACP methyl ester carboxylesterase